MIERLVTLGTLDVMRRELLDSREVPDMKDRHPETDYPKLRKWMEQHDYLLQQRRIYQGIYLISNGMMFATKVMTRTPEGRPTHYITVPRFVIPNGHKLLKRSFYAKCISELTGVTSGSHRPDFDFVTAHATVTGVLHRIAQDPPTYVIAEFFDAMDLAKMHRLVFGNYKDTLEHRTLFIDGQHAFTKTGIITHRHNNRYVSKGEVDNRASRFIREHELVASLYLEYQDDLNDDSSIALAVLFELETLITILETALQLHIHPLLHQVARSEAAINAIERGRCYTANMLGDSLVYFGGRRTALLMPVEALPATAVMVPTAQLTIPDIAFRVTRGAVGYVSKAERLLHSPEETEVMERFQAMTA